MVSFESAFSCQVSILVGSLNKKNYKLLVSEASQLVDQYGSDCHLLLLRSLLESVDFKEGGNHALKLQLLAVAVEKMLEQGVPGTFVSVFCRALLDAQSPRTDLLSDLSKAAKLPLWCEVELALSLAECRIAEWQTEATRFLKAKLEEVANNPADLSHATLHRLLCLLHPGVVPSKHLPKMMAALCEDRPPVVVLPLMHEALTDVLSTKGLLDDLYSAASFGLEAGADDVAGMVVLAGARGHPLMPHLLTSAPLAQVVEELGYGCTSSREVFRQLVLVLGPTQAVLTHASVAALLAMCARTGQGHDDGSGALGTLCTTLGIVGGSGVGAAALPLATPVDGTAGLEVGAGVASWDIDVVLAVVQELAPWLRWREVFSASHLDHDEFFVPDAAAFRSLVAVHQAACQEAFPMSALLGHVWRNAAGQLSFLQHAVAAPPDRFPAAWPDPMAPLEDVTGGARPPSPPCWLSLGLMETLAMLAEAGHGAGVRSMLEYPLRHHPEALLLACAHTKTNWAFMQAEVTSLLAPYMASSHPAVPALLARLWSHLPHQRLVVHAMAECYVMEPATVPRLLELAAELRALPVLLDAAPLPLAIDLASHGARRDLLPFPLDKWLADKVAVLRGRFVSACLSYLRDRLLDRGALAEAGQALPLGNAGAGGKQGGAALLEITATFLKFLNAHAGLLSPEVQEELKRVYLAVVAAAPKLMGAGSEPAPPAEVFASDIEEEANSYFQKIYTSQQSIEDVVAMLRGFKSSPHQREQEIFACMIHNLFDEYRFFPKYPDKELRITGILFGLLIRHQLVSSITLGIALRYVLDALRKPPPSKMFKFGLVALDQFLGRLPEWPQYCAHVLQIPHMRQAHPDLIKFVEQALAPDTDGMRQQQLLQQQQGAGGPPEDGGGVPPPAMLHQQQQQEALLRGGGHERELRDHESQSRLLGMPPDGSQLPPSLRREGEGGAPVLRGQEEGLLLGKGGLRPDQSRLEEVAHASGGQGMAPETAQTGAAGPSAPDQPPAPAQQAPSAGEGPPSQAQPPPQQSQQQQQQAAPPQTPAQQRQQQQQQQQQQQAAMAAAKVAAVQDQAAAQQQAAAAAPTSGAGEGAQVPPQQPPPQPPPQAAQPGTPCKGAPPVAGAGSNPPSVQSSPARKGGAAAVGVTATSAAASAGAPTAAPGMPVPAGAGGAGAGGAAASGGGPPPGVAAPSPTRSPVLNAQAQRATAAPATGGGAGPSPSSSLKLDGSLREGSAMSSFGSLNVETLTAAAAESADIKVPGESISDKVHFIINNISVANLEAKAKDVDTLCKGYGPWFAQYMVVKRASIEPNYHDMYVQLLDKLPSMSPAILGQVLKATYENVHVLLKSEKIKSSSSERSLLKNLGSWLGKLTIARNKPVLANDLDPKALIREAFRTGRMIAVIPFVSKVLEPCMRSKVFRPPNPWVMAIMALLAEVYGQAELKLNLKFEVEVLCKHLGLDIHEIKPSRSLDGIVRETAGNPDFSQSRAPQPMVSMSPVPPAGAATTAASGPAATPAGGAAPSGQDAGRLGAPGMDAAAVGGEPSSQALATSMDGGMGGAAPPLGTFVPTAQQQQQMDMAQQPQQMVGAGGMGGAPGPGDAGAGGGMGPLMPGGMGGAGQGPPQGAGPFGGVPAGGSFLEQQPLIPNLQAYITISPTLGVLAQQLNLKRVVTLAVDRAIREIISPVAERSVTIASMTTRELILKDFAAEPDETRMRSAANLMVSSLAGSLALVTCKEPLRVSMINHHKQLLAGANVEPSVLEQVINATTGDNLDLGCALIEKAATEKAVHDMDEVLAPAYAARRKHREATGQPYYDVAQLSASRYPAALPESLRPAPGRLTVQQLRVYEDFGRIPRQAPPQPQTGQGQEGRPPPPGQPPLPMAAVAGLQAPPLPLAPQGAGPLRGGPLSVSPALKMGGAAGGVPAAGGLGLGSVDGGDVFRGGGQPLPLGYAPQGGQLQPPLPSSGGGVPGGEPLLPSLGSQGVAGEPSQAGPPLGGGAPLAGPKVPLGAAGGALRALGGMSRDVAGMSLLPEAPTLSTGDALEQFQALVNKVSFLVQQVPPHVTSVEALPSDHQLRYLVAELPRIVVHTVSRDEAALAMAQKLYKRLYENSGSALHLSAHLALLQALRDVCRRVVKELTNWVIYSEEERKLSPAITLGLVRAQLINLMDFNAHLAKLMDGGRNVAATDFALVLVKNCLLKAPQLASAVDFVNVLDAISKIVSRPGTDPATQEALKLLLEGAHAATGPVEPASLLGGGEHAKGRPTDAKDANKIMLVFEEWLRIGELAPRPDSNKAMAQFLAGLQQGPLLKGDEAIGTFFRILLELAVSACLAQQGKDTPDASGKQLTQDSALGDGPSGVRRPLNFHWVDALARLCVLLVKHLPPDVPAAMAGGAVPPQGGKLLESLTLLGKVLASACRQVLDEHDEKGAAFNPRPFFRFFLVMLSEFGHPDPYLDSSNLQLLMFFATTFLSLQPSRCPGFSFAWLELIASRTFLPKLLLPAGQKGWPAFQRLLIALFKFMEPFLRNAELAQPVRLLYKGTLRLLLVLLHDFPEFLCDNHFSLCDVIPPTCIQMRNLILSAFPRNMRLPDPFTPNLKVDLLPEITQSPRILLLDGEQTIFKNKQLKMEVDVYLKTRQPVQFLHTLPKRLLLLPQQAALSGTHYNLPLINTLVLYVGMQVGTHACST
eukprot:jgi/Mesvir1/4857/Mv11131-RA.2